MKIFAIESSCDETAASVVIDGVKEVCSVVASSKDFHEKTGGVVPEIAARKQVEFIVPVIDETLKKLDGDMDSIDAIAVTAGPGLIGSLIVGVEAAKALALAWNKPLIPVNHLLGHIYANFVDSQSTVNLPAVALLVSGGHTDLIFLKDHGNFEYLGGTLDDAAGEAFDKTARLLGLAKYLGGVELSNLAATCETNTISGTLPRSMLEQPNFDFSFSGLKTAVRRLIENNKDIPNNVIAREFEDAVCDVLVTKTIKAAQTYNVKTILMGGGVAANSRLRSRLEFEATKLGISLHVPPLRLCTDNAVYIAAAAYFNQEGMVNITESFERIKADPSLSIMDKF